jgi:hypothetical protein
MNQISAFEYVSILISIILGLGITQILSSFSDLLYHFKKIKFYYPHSIWIGFVLFLHIQDWFVTYQLKDKMVWRLPELLFILLYPISLFIAAKMLLPTNDDEERFDMKIFYQSQFPMIFSVISVSILLSLLFNLLFLNKTFIQQIPLLIFLITMIFIAYYKIQHELTHKFLALIILLASILSIILEEDVWIIK